MKEINRISAWRPAIVASVVALCSTASWAARSFTPQAGTWMVSEEIDGKPGRGLAIDVQGNTFFMQVFAYEKNGHATFYTATAQMDGTTATAPLMRYKAGRSFGGRAQDAVEDGSPGVVTVSFSNGILGSVRFPGEEEKKIERFLVNDPDFDDAVLAPSPDATNIGKTGKWLLVDQGGNFVDFLGAGLSKAEGENYRLSLSSRFSGYRASYDCQRLSGVQSFSCQALVSDAATSPYADLKFQMIGPEVVGTLKNSSGDILEIAGVQRAMGSLGGAIVLCGMYEYAYMPAGCDQWQMPSNGTWVFADELTGRPGRGFSVDMQDKVAILQIFNYLPDGRSTFHMGSAVIGRNPVTGTTNPRIVPIQRYQGGRYLGGPASAAAPVSDGQEAGAAVIEFSGRNEDRIAPYVEGTFQLPGEEVKPVKRLDLQGLTPFSRLAGEWAMAFSNAVPPGVPILRKVRFSSTDNASATSDDGLVQCTKNPYDLSRYVCHLYADSTRAVVQGSLSARFNGFTADEDAIQLKDQFANWRGVGQISND